MSAYIHNYSRVSAPAKHYLKKTNTEACAAAF